MDSPGPRRLAADEPPCGDRSKLAAEFFAEHGNLSGTKVVLFLGRLHATAESDEQKDEYDKLRRRVL